MWYNDIENGGINQWLLVEFYYIFLRFQMDMGLVRWDKPLMISLIFKEIKPENMASFTDWTDILWRLSLSNPLKIRRKSLFHRFGVLVS
jgi:hypothetical protein